jgi:hypothetical protein
MPLKLFFSRMSGGFLLMEFALALALATLSIFLMAQGMAYVTRHAAKLLAQLQILLPEKEIEADRFVKEMVTEPVFIRWRNGLIQRIDECQWQKMVVLEKNTRESLLTMPDLVIKK